MRGQQRRYHTEVDLKSRRKEERLWWLWAWGEKYEVLRRWEKLRLQQRWRSRGLPCNCLTDLCPWLCTTCITIHPLIGALYHLTHSGDACNALTKWIKCEGIYPSVVAFVATNTCLFLHVSFTSINTFYYIKVPFASRALKGCWNDLTWLVSTLQYIIKLMPLEMSECCLKMYLR